LQTFQLQNSSEHQVEIKVRVVRIIASRFSR
jgi:hypothetical protein